MNFLIFIFFIVFALTNCTSNPSNNRKQLTIIPNSIINHLSDSYYYQFLEENRISKDKNLNLKIRNISERIEVGIKKYFYFKNKYHLYDKFSFEYETSIIKDNRTLNAFALPTAKIVFYSRKLDLTDNDAMIAAIIAHEMGHVVALHSQERMSHAFALEALSLVISGVPGAGSLLADIGYFLPFSRFQEKEADELGLIFMCFAGYEPKNAILFWEKIFNYHENVKKYKSNNDLVSSFKRTHPLTKKRIKNLNNLLDLDKINCK